MADIIASILTDRLKAKGHKVIGLSAVESVPDNPRPLCRPVSWLVVNVDVELDVVALGRRRSHGHSVDLPLAVADPALLGGTFLALQRPVALG